MNKILDILFEHGFLHTNLLTHVHVQQPLPSQEVARPVWPPPIEGEIVGRGRQKSAPGAVTAEGSFTLPLYPVSITTDILADHSYYLYYFLSG